MVQLPKSALRALMVAAAAFMALLIGASSAGAYPGCVFEASADKRVVASGSDVTIGSSANAECDWSIEWNGTTRTGSGMSFSATYTAPVVSRSTVIDAHVTCTYEDTACTPTGNARMAANARTATWAETIPVRVNPAAQGGGTSTATAGDSGVLPNTGGPSLFLLLGALLLLAAGGGAVYASRRQTAEATVAGSEPTDN